MSTLKTELAQLKEYTKKMFPKIKDLIENLFGVRSPKIDIIFGTFSAIKGSTKEESILSAVSSYCPPSCYGYPFILHQVGDFIEVAKVHKKSLGQKIKPAHLSVVALSEEYGHYVYDWLYDFRITGEAERLYKEIGLGKGTFGEKREKAVGSLFSLEKWKRWEK